MGSKPRDQQTMTTAATGATGADASLVKQADANTAFSQAARSKLFGTDFGSGGLGSNGEGGTLSKFLDPNSLNVSGPTGAYGLQYNKAVENIAKQGHDARGTTSRYLASRGFGNGPAGFAADQERRATQAQTDTQGQAFTDYAGKSYNDALSNFWNANNLLSGGQAQAMTSAVAGDQAAAGNYANLYSTASTPKPSVWGQVLGGVLSGAGQLGGAYLGRKHG